MRLSILDTAVTAVFLGFGIWILAGAAALGVTSEQGPGPGTFPMISGILVTVFSAAALVRGWKARASDGEAAAPAGGAVTLPELARVAGIVLAVMAYIAAFNWLGAFLPLPFLMVAISLVVHWRGELGWIATISAISVTFTFVCYLIFERGLGVLLPEGPLGF